LLRNIQQPRRPVNPRRSYPRGSASRPAIRARTA